MSLNFGDFIEKTNSAENPERLCALFEHAISEYGYDRYMYSMLTADEVHHWDKAPSILRNYPEDWMSFYIAKGLVGIDPVREFAFRSRGPFVWDKIPGRIDLSADQQLMLDRGTEAGLYCGVGVPFHGPFGEVAGIGLASSEKDAECTDTDLQTLGIVCAQFHNMYLHLAIDDTATPSIRLTPREKEVLLWCTAGKSNWAIGEILGISHHAIKFHISNCIAKLGVDSRITAALKAIRLGLIVP